MKYKQGAAGPHWLLQQKKTQTETTPNSNPPLTNRVPPRPLTHQHNQRERTTRTSKTPPTGAACNRNKLTRSHTTAQRYDSQE
ncbi:Hypothetical predicted protein, partial [Pelobates cultripes]